MPSTSSSIAAPQTPAPQTTDPQVTAPCVTAELFFVPVDERYIVYAPLRQAVFLDNAATAHVLDDFQQGCDDDASPDQLDLLELS